MVVIHQMEWSTAVCNYVCKYIFVHNKPRTGLRNIAMGRRGVSDCTSSLIGVHV